MACKAVFCWCCVSLLLIVQKKLPAIIEHNNGLDHKGNENVVGGVERLNFPVVTKSVTAEVKKVEIERAASVMALLNSNC